MDSFDGFVAIALVGIALFIVGVVMKGHKKENKTKSCQIAEFFTSYDKRMDEFRKQ
jgi:hypothetical protein